VKPVPGGVETTVTYLSQPAANDRGRTKLYVSRHIVSIRTDR
jgi:hypothetical protein